MDASELHVRRLNAVSTPKMVKNMFPIADGTVKLFGRDHEEHPPESR